MTGRATDRVTDGGTDRAAARARLEAEVLRRITPDAQEVRDTETAARSIEAAADARLRQLRIPGKATVQGSLAKGTWLRGGGDVDLFLLLDPSVPEERLEGVAESVAEGLIEAPAKRYAQHPYLVGTRDGRTVDLVPAYKVANAGARMSAVDRTPFHTEWVRAHLDAAGRGQVRLLKRWLKGIGAYGAQTAVGGVSGYLAEVLVARLGSFDAVVRWLAQGAQPRRLSLGADEVKDEVSPLVVVDPVDAARNCAAAVQQETLDLAVEAARAYEDRPDERFFFPEPPRAEPAQALRASLASQGAAWIGVLLRPRTDRLDLVLPQFQKGARAVAAALAQAGFPVRRHACTAAPDGGEVLLQFAAEAAALPESRVHRGPSDAARVHAERFRAKWEGHPDAAGPVAVAADGRLEVEVRVPHRTAAAWLKAHLGAVPLGRHVTDAMPDARVLDDVAQVPPAWAPEVADFALARRPWQR